jgi:hypothetical protein
LLIRFASNDFHIPPEPLKYGIWLSEAACSRSQGSNAHLEWPLAHFVLLLVEIVKITFFVLKIVLAEIKIIHMHGYHI